jgi:transcription antitermination factor NusG
LLYWANGEVELYPAGNNILPWFAVRVRSNFEQKVCASLSGMGYETFLPTYRQRRAWTDRVKETDVPLFPGYTFCRIDPAFRLPLLKVPGVVSMVGAAKRPEPIPDEEISAIRTIIETRLTVQPWPFLHVGQKIKIHKGPLSGVEGILVGFKDDYRMVVSVTLLKRSVAVQLEGAWVRPQ